MTRVRLCVAMLVALLAGFEASAGERAQPGEPTPSIIYQLLTDERVDPNAQTIGCRLRIENVSEELQLIVRPDSNDLSLNIEGYDPNHYSVVFPTRDSHDLRLREIPLRPGYAIEISLAEFVCDQGSEGGLVLGKYSIVGSWRRPSQPQIRPAVFEVAAADEYPLDILLEPLGELYHEGEPLIMKVRLKNRGTWPVMIEHVFDSDLNRITLGIENSESGNELERPSGLAAAISPHPIRDWNALFPNESLLLRVDATEDPPISGSYRVFVKCHMKILIYPADGRPFYTKQNVWTSDKVDITIGQ